MSEPRVLVFFCRTAGAPFAPPEFCEGRLTLGDMSVGELSMPAEARRDVEGDGLNVAHVKGEDDVETIALALARTEPRTLTFATLSEGAGLGVDLELRDGDAVYVVEPAPEDARLLVRVEGRHVGHAIGTRPLADLWDTIAEHWECYPLVGESFINEVGVIHVIEDEHLALIDRVDVEGHTALADAIEAYIDEGNTHYAERPIEALAKVCA